MRVRLLGPVDVIANGQLRPVHGLRRKAILATLALHGGEIVSTGRLVDIVWGKAVSAAAVNTLQSHLSYLRNALGSKTAIVARPPGYVLDLDNGDTDVQRAEWLLRESRRAADPAEAVRSLREASALWRGEPLVDVAGLGWLDEQAERLDMLRVQVERALFAARLAVGEHDQLVPGLVQLASEHPLDEQVHAQLMMALYRAGRQAEALAVYHRLRRTLSEGLGLDPSQQLRELETAILRQDPALDPSRPGPATAALATTRSVTSAAALAVRPASAREIALVQATSPARPLFATAPVPPSASVPAQLPPAVASFTGRHPELANLGALLPHSEAGTAAADAGTAGADAGTAELGAVVISVISGTAGVGKTALAVYWAHRVAERFPDGQLYVNLRGFDPAGPPLDPVEAVRGFLDALGVVAERIPRGLSSQVALYRSILAGKRMLVVLDNAHDAEQVRPLLPGSPGCLVIVTSRSQLIGLVAAEGAIPLTLDLLTAAEAWELLTGRLGESRVAGDRAAARDIIERCARLPLALAIVAARAVTKPGFPLAAVAAELREAARTLDPLSGADSPADVRAVFSWSYRALSHQEARLFRLLGLHPGPDIAPAAAASLAATSMNDARALLAALADAHLLAEHSPGRYACHDLLRAYAAEQAHEHESPEAKDAALRRVLDYYLHTSHNAAMLMEPYLGLPVLARPRHGAIAGEPRTAQDAVAWFAAEQATALTAVQFAAGNGLESHAWQLAWTLTSFLLRRGLWHEQAAACQTGLEAARRSGDLAGEAHTLQRLAEGYARSGYDGDAHPLFRQALRLFEAIGGRTSQATIHNCLAWLAGRAQRPADALSHSMHAHDLFRAAGHQAGQARSLNNIGYSHALLGDFLQALAHCRQSLAMVQQLGAHDWEAIVWCSLGYINNELGNTEQAIACYQRSAELCRDCADRYNEAAALGRLGDVHDRAGDAAAASLAWEQALRLYDELGHPDGDKLRARLHPAADSRTIAAGGQSG